MTVYPNQYFYPTNYLMMETAAILSYFDNLAPWSMHQKTQENPWFPPIYAYPKAT